MKPLPGSYGVVHCGTWFGRIISRFTGSPYNHAFLVLDHANVWEARPRGAGLASLQDYIAMGARFSEDTLTKDQRDSITRWAVDHIGVRYGFLDIGALALHIALHLDWAPLWWIIGREHRLICSQAVAMAYQQAAGITLVPGKDAQEVTPADLAERLG